MDTPYNTSETATGDLLIRVGQADVYLKEGKYEYTVAYESYGHIGFFDANDELYWNVTGNETTPTTEQDSATVALPPGAEGLQAACYTGSSGGGHSGGGGGGGGTGGW